MSRPRPRKVKASSRSFAGNHQRSWLWGRHAVTETLIAAQWPVYDLIVDEDDASLVAREILPLAQRLGLVCHRANDARLSQLTGTQEHQGVAARMGEFPLHDVAALVACATASAATTVPLPASVPASCDTTGIPVAATSVSNRTPREPPAAQGDSQADRSPQALNAVLSTWPPVFVVCDRIQDAHNFGAILRCCDAAGVRGVIVGRWQQSGVTPHVARSSAGAVNHLQMFQVDSLATAVLELKNLGYAILGASEKADKSIWDAPVTDRMVLIVGSEATGISAELLALCTQKLGIPMLGQVSSLNVAVATGIVLTEIRRRHRALSHALSAPTD